MEKLKNGKVAGKDEVTGEMVKHEDYMVVDWIWRLCNMAFESGVVPEDWKYVNNMLIIKERVLNVRIIEALDY